MVSTEYTTTRTWASIGALAATQVKVHPVLLVGLYGSVYEKMFFQMHAKNTWDEMIASVTPWLSKALMGATKK